MTRNAYTIHDCGMCSTKWWRSSYRLNKDRTLLSDAIHRGACTQTLEGWLWCTLSSHWVILEKRWKHFLWRPKAPLACASRFEICPSSLKFFKYHKNYARSFLPRPSPHLRIENPYWLSASHLCGSGWRGEQDWEHMKTRGRFLNTAWKHGRMVAPNIVH